VAWRAAAIDFKCLDARRIPVRAVPYLLRGIAFCTGRLYTRARPSGLQRYLSGSFESVSHQSSAGALQTAALASVFLLALALSGCAGPAAVPAMPPTEVGALEMQPGSMQLSLEHAAQLRGVREVEVRAQVSGILLKRQYREGSRVRANDLLFRIDPAPFEADAARARADLAVQQANLSQAKRERDRILQIYEQKLASLHDRDTALATFEGAEASFAGAQAALAKANLDVAYTQVRAPISGLTSREARSEGSLVTAGSDSSLLTRIVQTDQLYVDFSVPEAEAEGLRAAMAGAAAAAVSVRIADIEGRTLGENAKIEFIAPSIGDETGTVDVRAVIDNARATLFPGQVVRALVQGVTLPGMMVIPKRAVMHGMQGTFVWVVGGDFKIAPRPVKLGATSGNNVVVSDGLAAGDRIVVDGILKVQPGAVVRTTPVNLDGNEPTSEPKAKS
jgi:membrane fusion protein (multidrug efflux system)